MAKGGKQATRMSPTHSRACSMAGPPVRQAPLETAAAPQTSPVSANGPLHAPAPGGLVIVEDSNAQDNADTLQ